MTYKDAINLFEVQYTDLCLQRNITPLKFSNKEIFTRLSIIQSELSNVYRLYDKTTTLNLTAGTYEYLLETLITDCLDVIGITYNNLNLEKISVEEMNLIVNSQSTPTAYTIYGIGSARKIKFDYSDTLTLTIHYYARLKVYDSSNTDYEETKTGFGGSFVIPEEYHYQIIEGALAKIFPDLMAIHYEKVQELNKRRQIVYSGKPTYFLGV